MSGEALEQQLKEMFAEIGRNWDLPDNVVAVGNPCKVLREVNECDREYYFKDRRIDWREVCDTP